MIRLIPRRLVFARRLFLPKAYTETNPFKLFVWQEVLILYMKVNFRMFT